MKKLFTLSTAALLAFSLAACSNNSAQPAASTPTPEASAAAETGTGVYTIWNTTGENVTELYVFDNSGTDKGENYAEGGLKNFKSVEVTKADVPTDTAFTLEFTTASGYTGKFETLHVEEAAINLPAEDALTGATQISFGEPTLTAEYVIYNQTGETVKELFLTANGEEKGDNLAGDAGLADGKNVTVTIDMPASETADWSSTLEFTTEGGYTGTFETLHFEEAPISLIAEDAKTGATQIAFSAPEAEAEYTIYNVTGEKVTDLYLYETGDADKGENYAADGLADGDSIVLGSTESAYTARKHVYTLEFTTEGGYTGKFETLHFEVAPISLLAEDALTGATQISFSAPK